MKSRIFSMLFPLFNVFYRRRSCQADFLAYQIQMLRKRLKKDFIIPSVEEGKDIGNKPLDKSFVPKDAGPVKCASSLAGLLNSYYRDSA